MTATTTSMPLLIREQSAQVPVEATSGQSASTDAEARALASAIARGDEQAFRSLYDRFHDRLLRLALVLGRGDESLAQDLVQTVFVIAAKKLRRVDNEDHLWNWLAQVARQTSVKAWRKRQRDPAMAQAEALTEDCPANTEPDSFLEETLDVVLKALDVDEQQLVRNLYFDRLSLKEIADLFG